MRFDMLDFPTAWEIQNEGAVSHDPHCSSVPGWHPLSGPALLCDCGAVEAEWERRRDAMEAEYQTSTEGEQTMTPIKDIIWCGVFVGVRDHVNEIGTWMTTTDEQRAEWIASAIAKAHGVPVLHVLALPPMRLPIAEGNEHA